MLKTRLIVLSLLALSLMLTACGGGTSGLIGDDLGSGKSFTAVRFSDAGSTDSSLNGTLNLQAVSSGDVTTVMVAVADVDPMWGVALNLNYDASRYNPVSVEFNNLIDTPLSFSSTKVSGLIGISQVDVNGTAVRNGDFATVTFRNEPSKSVSAAGDVYGDALDIEYDVDALTTGVVGYEFDATSLAYTIRSIFAQGDGNRDGFTTAADITPIGQYWGEVMISDTDFTPAIGDYDRNGMITAGDLTPLGQRFNEQVTGFEFWAFDTAAMTDAGVMLGTEIAWGDGTMTARPTGAITDWGEVFAVWTGTVDPAGFPEDTDADGFVYVTARAVNGTDEGAYVAATAVAVGPPPPTGVSITDFTVQIVNATGGSAGGADLFADGDAAVVLANAEVTLNVTDLVGTIGGVPFVGDDANIETADYDAALASLAAMVNWTPVNSGDVGMQKTADVLVLSATTGNGVTGTVFPDNDRGAISAEGILEVDVAATTPPNVFVPGAISYDVNIDVDMDPVAPRVVGIMSSAGMEGADHAISAVGNTTLTYAFDFGTFVPADMADVGVTLFDLTDETEVMAFTYTTDPDPAVNQVIIRDNPNALESTKQLVAVLGGGNVAAGHIYTVRIEAPPYNSVNDPGEFLMRGDYPPEVEYNTIPDPDQVLSVNDFLWLFYPEPMLRRNPQAVYNILTDTIEPADEDGFNDIIKTTGNEFSYEFIGSALYPKVVIRHDPDNNTDPSSIAVSDPQAGGVNQAYTCPGYIVMDILAITTEGGPGEPAVHYDYRVFAAGAPLGFGEFTVIKELMGPGTATGIDWGINIFDGDETVATRDYVDAQTLDGTTVGTAAPDVLFVEFGGGQVGDWDDPLADADNTQLMFTGLTGDTMMSWDPRVAINADGTMIVVHAFTALDYSSALPGWPGHLEAPGPYTLQLLDTAGTLEYSFTDTLTITGPNPND